MTTGPGTNIITALVADLLASTSFEAAAMHSLRYMLERVAEIFEHSQFSKRGRIVRGLVHLRPGDGYRGLAVLELGAADLAPIDTRQTRLTSTTAWRWVAETRASVAIDVSLGQVQPLGASAIADSRLGKLGFAGQESQIALLQREVSHMLALPLRGPLGAVDGMICIEAACRDAMGKPFIWPECSAWLQLLSDIATPYLVNLPSKPGMPAPSDALLPVVGATMARLVDMLRTFAQQEEPILITGPTGAGKSRLARWCHEQSPRRDRPFEVLDLSAVPEELQMAELFGWKKGAFTGATRDNQGYLGRAKGGTVFIDEVDNLSPRAQSGLLHVLEERSYRSLGDGRRDMPADVRFMIGSNASLRNAVREKRFREDLYYRINVLPIQLPRLEDRSDEIPLWARYMVSRRHESGAPGHASLSDQAERLLARQPWPGNLRQLDNIVRRAYAIAVMSHGGRSPHNIVLEEEHVRHAIAYECAEPSSAPLDAFLLAASNLVAVAERRAGGAMPLDLDVSEGFKGFVLGVAAEKLGGDRDRVFELLGKERLVKGRNHHKVFRRELERAAELSQALGVLSFPFASLLNDPEAP